MGKQQYIEQLFNTMGQLRKLVESQAQESQEERSATLMQFSALKFLRGEKNCMVSDMACSLGLSKSSATQLIERLEKAGFVERIHDSQDRRIVRLVITPLGEEEIVLLKKKFIHKMGKTLSKIPEEDLKELVRIHTNLIETLQK